MEEVPSCEGAAPRLAEGQLAHPPHFEAAPDDEGNKAARTVPQTQRATYHNAIRTTARTVSSCQTLESNIRRTHVFQVWVRRSAMFIAESWSLPLFSTPPRRKDLRDGTNERSARRGDS